MTTPIARHFLLSRIGERCPHNRDGVCSPCAADAMEAYAKAACKPLLAEIERLKAACRAFERETGHFTHDCSSRWHQTGIATLIRSGERRGEAASGTA